GVTSADYEIIVVDNGSDPPLSVASCELDGGVVRVARCPSRSASPVGAVNAGLQLARGEIRGVMIDGARMASPGLIAGALLAARLHHRPVISTVSFHLGYDVQMRSVRNGYDTRTEDALLETVGWPEDGYRLFDIATFALSSWNGWFGRI